VPEGVVFAESPVDLPPSRARLFPVAVSRTVNRIWTPKSEHLPLLSRLAISQSSFRANYFYFS
jgi:hypothetical protein